MDEHEDKQPHYEETPDHILSDTAKAVYRGDLVAMLFDFGIEHDFETGGPSVVPFDVETDPELKALLEAIPDADRVAKRLPDRPPYSQSFDWGFVISVLKLLGLPTAIEVGRRVLGWLRARKGRSANAGTLMPVAIYYVVEQVPDAKPDPSRVQVLDPVLKSPYPRDHQVVFLYRIYDLDGKRVYLVEVDSVGQLVSLNGRTVGMFEGPENEAR